MKTQAAFVILALVLGSPFVSAQTGPAAYRPLSLGLAPAPAEAEGGGGNSEIDQKAELMKEMLNPVSSLISVPIQNNWDFGIGPANAMKYTANIQPVAPFAVSQDWNMIVRTILPVIYQGSRFAGDGSHSGLGDITQSFFLSPKDPPGGWILGGGAALLYPTATDSALGMQKWGAGPTAVVLRQDDAFTYGLLANHIWSYAGWGTREVNATFLQPFVAYTFKTETTLQLNAESTYDWQARQWSVPLNFSVDQLVEIDKQPIDFELGFRFYAEGPQGGPDWGIRFTVTFMFPN